MIAVSGYQQLLFGERTAMNRLRLRQAATIASASMVLAACAVDIKAPNLHLPGQSGDDVGSKKVTFQTTETIRPTAIVLHWSGIDAHGDVKTLVNRLKGQKIPDTSRSGQHRVSGSTQILITGKGRVVQLTEHTNSLAHHAACADKWAVGVWIEGTGTSSVAQLKAVVKVVSQLIGDYSIKLDSKVGNNAKSGQGILSQAQVAGKCTWDGKRVRVTSRLSASYLRDVMKGVRS